MPSSAGELTRQLETIVLRQQSNVHSVAVSVYRHVVNRHVVAAVTMIAKWPP